MVVTLSCHILLLIFTELSRGPVEYEEKDKLPKHACKRKSNSEIQHVLVIFRYILKHIKYLIEYIRLLLQFQFFLQHLYSLDRKYSNSEEAVERAKICVRVFTTGCVSRQNQPLMYAIHLWFYFISLDRRNTRDQM